MKLLETWYKCTGGSSDENIVTKFFLSSKHVLYRPERPESPFFYRGPYFCNRNSYNVDTGQARVFGVDKSLAKFWYCILPGCVFYRPEHIFFKGHPCNWLTCWLNFAQNFRIFLQSA